MHPPAAALKNADEMLKAILSIVDTSGDGKIQYEGGFPILAQVTFGRGTGATPREVEPRG